MHLICSSIPFARITTFILGKCKSLFSEEHRSWGKRTVSSYSDMNNTSYNEKIVFECKIHFYLPPDYDPEVLDLVQNEARAVKYRMLELFENENLCDVIFRMDDENISVSFTCLIISSYISFEYLGTHSSCRSQISHPLCLFQNGEYIR